MHRERCRSLAISIARRLRTWGLKSQENCNFCQGQTKYPKELARQRFCRTFGWTFWCDLPQNPCFIGSCPRIVQKILWRCSCDFWLWGPFFFGPWFGERWEIAAAIVEVCTSLVQSGWIHNYDWFMKDSQSGNDNWQKSWKYLSRSVIFTWQMVHDRCWSRETACKYYFALRNCFTVLAIWSLYYIPTDYHWTDNYYVINSEEILDVKSTVHFHKLIPKRLM